VRYHSSYEKSAHLYDLFDRKPNVEFLRRYGSGFAEVVDIGSGTGRIAIPLAQRGTVVYCVEPSPAMRREFTRKLAVHTAIADRILLLGGNAESFALRRRFPAAFMFGVFDHLIDDNTRLLALENINHHLMPGGTLVMDLCLDGSKDSAPVPAGDYRIGNKEYRRFIGSEMCRDDKKRVTLVFETYESGKLVERIEERGMVGIVFRRRLLSLLENTGFVVVNEFGDYESAAYNKGDESLIIEARKKTTT
jgi:SAM-dependent methyltransferase